MKLLIMEILLSPRHYRPGNVTARWSCFMFPAIPYSSLFIDANLICCAGCASFVSFFCWPLPSLRFSVKTFAITGGSASRNRSGEITRVTSGHGRISNSRSALCSAARWTAALGRRTLLHREGLFLLWHAANPGRNPLRQGCTLCDALLTDATYLRMTEPDVHKGFQ